MRRTENVKDQEALENRTESHDTDHEEIQLSKGLKYFKTLEGCNLLDFRMFKKVYVFHPLISQRITSYMYAFIFIRCHFNMAAQPNIVA